MCSWWSQEANQLNGKIYLLVILSKCSLRCWYLPGLVAWEDVSPTGERRNSAAREPSFTFRRLAVMQLLYSASALEQNQLITDGCTQGHWKWECCVFDIWTRNYYRTFPWLIWRTYFWVLLALWSLTWGVNWRKTEMLLTWLCSKSSLGAMTAIQMRFEISL